MNDKPTPPLRPGLRYRLVPGGPTAPLAFEPVPPMVGASLADRLLVAARDAARGKVRVFSVDPGGEISTPAQIPLDDITDMVRCGGRVLLLGKRRGQWHCLVLDANCKVVGDVLLPVMNPPVLSPRCVPHSDPPAHVWIDARDRLVIARGMRAATVPLEGWTSDLACQATPKGLAFFRCAGAAGKPELLLWREGRLRHRQVGQGEDQGYSPLLFREKGHLLALWVSRPRQAICMQVYSESLAACQGARELRRAATPQSFYWISGFHAEDRGLVLAWQTGPGDESILGEGAPTTKQCHFALLDPWRGMLSEPISLHGPAESLPVGGWADNSLIVVMGGAGRACVFHLRSAD